MLAGLNGQLPKNGAGRKREARRFSENIGFDEVTSITGYEFGTGRHIGGLVIF
jgi:hypothetical protein